MDLRISDILAMQTELQKKYEGIWEPISPQRGVKQLLWSICEMGEVADIIKKKGDDAIMNDPKVRASFTEEFADVLMYLGDLLMCYGVNADEMSRAFAEKHEYNMRREYKGVTHYEQKNDD